MNQNEKMAADIAAQLGLKQGKAISKAQIESWEKKSDAQIAAEILKIKEQLKKSNVSTEKQVAMIKSLMPMMDSIQKARLKNIIELLER